MCKVGPVGIREAPVQLQRPENGDLEPPPRLTRKRRFGGWPTQGWWITRWTTAFISLVVQKGVVSSLPRQIDFWIDAESDVSRLRVI